MLIDAGVLTAPQNEVINLCAGEQLSIMCSTSRSYLDLIIQFPQYEYGVGYTFSVHDSSMSYSRLLRACTSAITINFTKNSEAGVIPLISTLIITDVTTDLNGAVIDCNGLELGYSHIIEERISVTVIHVINGKNISQYF